MLDRSLRPVLGWTASLIVFAVVGSLVLAGVCFNILLVGYNDYAPGDVVLASVLALVFGVSQGVLRVALRWPGGSSAYAKFLITSPWEMGKPLPLGSYHLTIGDVLMTLLAGTVPLVLRPVHPVAIVLLPLVGLLVAHSLMWWFVLMIEPAIASAWRLIYLSVGWLVLGLLPVAAMSGPHDALWMMAGLMATCMAFQWTLQLATARVLADFPWHSPMLQGSMPDEKKRRALAASGWPFQSLGPGAAKLSGLRGRRLFEWPFASSALAATLIVTIPMAVWGYGSYLSAVGRHIDLPESLFVLADDTFVEVANPLMLLPVVAVLAFAAILRCQSFGRGTRSPLSLLARLRTLRPMSWSYSRVWIEPTCVVLAVALLSWGLLNLPIPLPIISWMTLFCGFVALSCVGPDRETWRLTSTAVEATIRRPQTKRNRRRATRDRRAWQDARPDIAIQLSHTVATAILCVLCVAIFVGMEMVLQRLMRDLQHVSSYLAYARLVGVMALTTYAVFEVIRFRMPSLQPEYEQWLAMSAWVPWRPLPKGPMQPTWRDLLWLVPLTLWMGYFGDWTWHAVLTPTAALLLAWQIAMILASVIRHLTWQSLLVIASWPVMLIGLQHPLIVAATLVLGFILLQIDQRRYMLNFPAGTPWWRGKGGKHQRADAGIVEGWPWAAIAPIPETPLQWRPWREALHAAMFFSLMFVLLLPFWNAEFSDTDEVHTPFMVYVLIVAELSGLAALLQSVSFLTSTSLTTDTQLGKPSASDSDGQPRTPHPQAVSILGISYSPPLTLAGRLSLRRLLSSFDECWTLPVMSALIVIAIATIGRVAGVPVLMIIPLLVAVEIFTTSYVSHRIPYWRLLADTRFARDKRQEQQAQRTDPRKDESGDRGFKGIDTMLWQST